MTIEIRKRFGRTLAIVLLTLVAAVFVTARKIRDYAADPSGDKDCGPEPVAGAVEPPDRVATVTPSPIVPWKQRGGTVNDSSCLNRTPVFGVVKVESPDDVRHALRFAREQRLKVSIAGVRHSQGGQAFAKQAVVHRL